MPWASQSSFKVIPGLGRGLDQMLSSSPFQPKFSLILWCRQGLVSFHGWENIIPLFRSDQQTINLAMPLSALEGCTNLELTSHWFTQQSSGHIQQDHPLRSSSSWGWTTQVCVTLHYCKLPETMTSVQTQYFKHSWQNKVRGLYRTSFLTPTLKIPSKCRCFPYSSH